eukprot:6530034-Alexandrium_andersonii.AAC.1
MACAAPGFPEEVRQNSSSVSSERSAAQLSFAAPGPAASPRRSTMRRSASCCRRSSVREKELGAK